MIHAEMMERMPAYEFRIRQVLHSMKARDNQPGAVRQQSDEEIERLLSI